MIGNGIQSTLAKQVQVCNWDKNEDSSKTVVLWHVWFHPKMVFNLQNCKLISHQQAWMMIALKQSSEKKKTQEQQIWPIL